MEDQLRQDPSLTLDEAAIHIASDTTDAVVIPKITLMNGGDKKKLDKIREYLNGGGNTVITRDALILLPEGGYQQSITDGIQKSAKNSDAENSDTEACSFFYNSCWLNMNEYTR